MLEIEIAIRFVHLISKYGTKTIFVNASKKALCVKTEQKCRISECVFSMLIVCLSRFKTAELDSSKGRAS